MADREVRIKATTQGTDKAAKDFEKIADAEKKVGGAASDAGKATEEFKINQEAFTQTLNRINPALGGMAEGLLKAFVVAGDLSKANLSLTDILGKARGAVLKYRDALLLLGAGGAAVGAVLFLISQVQKLKRETEEALNLLEGFNTSQRFIEQRKEQVRKQVLKQFAKTKPTATDDEIRKAIDEAVNLIENIDVDPGRAVGIVTGQAPPLTSTERNFRRRHLGLGVRRSDAREQLRSFVTAQSPGSARKITTDTGEQGALLEFIQQIFGETGALAQSRIRGAQQLLDRPDLQGQSDEVIQALTGLTKEQIFSGQELLKNLGMADFKAAAGELRESAMGLRSAIDDLRSATADNARVADQTARNQASIRVEPQAMDAIS